MSTQVIFNGVTYSVPAVNEEDWQSLSNYLVALANAVPSGGSVSSNIRVSTSATTAVATSDYAVAINYSSGPATVNLPAGVAKQIFIITDASGTAATNNITINRNGSNTIFGGTSYVMTHNNQSVIIGFSGGNWYRLAESIPGAVEGPASSVVGGIAAFNNTTGDRLQNLGVGTADDVLRTDGTTPSFGKVVNENVSASAAIAYSKLALTNSIVNADISSGASIAYSKLNLTGTIVNADVNASAAIAYSKLDLTASIRNTDIFGAAAIAYSKLNLSGSIVNSDINASAAIAYSKLDLAGGIVNADVNASAAIDYSKLNLTGGIVNADINASAAIARSKIAAGSASHVVVNDGSGNLSSVATLPVSQGGTGLNTLGSALQVLRVDSLGTSLEFATLAAGSGDVVGPASSVTNGIVQFASTTGKALKDLGVGSANQVLLTNGSAPSFGQITNAYIDAAAAISYSKMESLTALKALITNGSGALITHPNTTADEIGYLFGVSSNIQIQLNAKLNLSGGTLTGALTIDTASNQLVLSSGVNALTVNGGTSAAARTYTVPDVGTTADFVMTAGTQTIAGAKTLSSALTITPVTNQIVLGTTNTTTINAAAPASSAVYTVPDVGTTASFVMTAGTQTIAGAKTLSNVLTLSAGATITGSISLTDTSSKIFTNTSDSADNKRIQIGGGGDASNSRGAYLNIYGNEYAGAGGYLDCIVGNVAGSLFRVIQLGVSTIVSETDSAVANTLYLKAGNVGIGTTNPIQARAVISKDQTNSSAAVFSNSHLRLIHNSVTNTTGVTALTASTGGSATDNYGISIGAQRYGATSAPKFFVRMHNNSDVGIEAITALETGAVTLGPTTDTPYTGFHTFYDNIFTGTPSATVDTNGMFYVGANTYSGSAGRQPTRRSGLSGSQIRFAPRTSNASQVFTVSVNQTADSATTTYDDVLYCDANGAWTLPLIHNIGAGNITSGRYTPTLTSVANIASATAQSSHYSRVGNTVTVSIWLSPISATAAASTVTRIRVSLPIASNFTAQTDAQGTANFFRAAATAAEAPGVVLANVAGDDLEVYWLSSTTSAGDILVVAQYEVK